MKRIKVKINSAGAEAILKSDEVLADLERRAKAIAAAAGDGFETSSMVGQSRARAGVGTGTREAMRSEAEDRSLTRALDAGRT